MEIDGSDGGKTMHMYLISDNGNYGQNDKFCGVYFTTIKKISFNWLHTYYFILSGETQNKAIIAMHS